MSHAQSDADSEGLDCLMERKKVCVGKLGSDDRRSGRDVQPHRNTAATDGSTTVLPGIAEVKVQQGKKTTTKCRHELAQVFIRVSEKGRSSSVPRCRHSSLCLHLCLSIIFLSFFFSVTDRCP